MNKKRLRNFLVGYWILLPILFYVYLFLLTVNYQTNLMALLNQIPTLTFAFLLSFVSLIQAYLLHRLTTREEEVGLLPSFVDFSIVQQLITANIIGLVLLFLYRLKVKQAISERAPVIFRARLEVYSLMVLVAALSLLVVILTVIIQK